MQLLLLLLVFPLTFWVYLAIVISISNPFFTGCIYFSTKCISSSVSFFSNTFIVCMYVCPSGPAHNISCHVSYFWGPKSIVQPNFEYTFVYSTYPIAVPHWATGDLPCSLWARRNYSSLKGWDTLCYKYIYFFKELHFHKCMVVLYYSFFSNRNYLKSGG